MNNSNDKNFWNTGIFDPDGINPNPLNDKPYSNSYKNLAKFWSNLPTYKQAKQITENIINNDVILIKAGTGAGKSVLIPKIALHTNNYQGKIIMTLPKKIITKKAAEFAAKTLDVELGEQVGYQFRGDNLKSSNTILLYSTDGSIISQIKSDPMLKSVDLIIIDEAHERKIQIDLLLYLLKNAIKLRKEKKIKPLKLIIMSATINEQIFKTYYSDFKFEWMELAGTPNYPIKSIYLESSLNLKSNQYLEKGQEIIGQIINKINSQEPEYIEGDILFFVCTISECNDISVKLGKLFPDSFTMGLYSGFDPELEQYISLPNKYKELNLNYKRRIFISTNVAESSLTIDGIVYVIDSGLELSVKFNPESNINIMKKNFITQAQMTQREGRAGRTKPGICYHLYTPQEQESCLLYPEPEIKRVDIKNTCLSMLKLANDTNPDKKATVADAINMFTHFIEPPNEKFITNGFDFAFTNGLIDTNNELSQIGKLIIETRLDVMDGLALLYGWNISSLVFKEVFKIISICSFIKSGVNDFFNKDIDSNIKNNLIKKIFAESENSEHLLLLNLYKYIELNKSSGNFQLELFNSIHNAYSKQIDKLDSSYKHFNIELKDINKKDLNTNIINSFGYGYKTNRAFRTGSIYKYNDIPIDLTKTIIKLNQSISTIIFYSNLNWANKLNIMICSQYLLE